MIVAVVVVQGNSLLARGDCIIPPLQLQRHPAEQLLCFGIPVARRRGRLQKLKSMIGVTLLEIANHVHAALGRERRHCEWQQEKDEQQGENAHETYRSGI
jgi:hypothetical protein